MTPPAGWELDPAVAAAHCRAMKPAPAFLIGLIVGAGVVFVITRRERVHPVPAAAAADHRASANAGFRQPVDRRSRSIDYHKPLFLTSRSGEEYRLYIYGQMGAPLKYEWRSTTDPLEEGGGGELFERYEVVREKPGGREIRDAGGRLVIGVGGHRLEWSAKDQSSGWIYFDAAEIQLGDESAIMPP